MWHPEAARGGTETNGSVALSGAEEEEGTVRSIHRILSEPVMGTSVPAILREAGAGAGVAMETSPSAAGRRPAGEGFGRAVWVLGGDVGESSEKF